MELHTCIDTANRVFVNQALISPKKQPLLRTDAQSKTGVGIFRFDQKKSREALAKMLLLHDHPFNVVEQRGFKEFCATLRPEFKIVSRNTVKADCMEMYNGKKNEIFKEFKDLTSRIALTADMWTSNQHLGYMAITAHYIDSDWVLKSRIINFHNVDPPHTGQMLADNITLSILNWNIENKLSCLTLDNCSTNDCIVRTLRNQLLKTNALVLNGKFFHMRCAAHILNLIVKDGLKDIDPIIENIREVVKYIKNSSNRIHQFRDIVSVKGLSSTRGLPLDVQTRWNSTYLMVSSALYFRDVFSYLSLTDDLHYKTLIPSDEEWDKVATLNDFLERFYEATNRFSARKYPTIHTFLPEVCTIHNELVQKLGDFDFVSARMAKVMMEKFDKYWKNYNQMFEIAILLDPSSKIVCLEWVFKILYETVEYRNTRMIEARNLFKKLYEEYRVRFGAKESDQIVNKNDATSRQFKRKAGDDEHGKARSLFLKYRNEISNKAVVEEKTELDRYFDDKSAEEDDMIDILQWWKLNSTKYPILSHMARDILAIPVSTVASESAFSTGGRVLDPHRTSLKPDTVEALVCAQDWFSHDPTRIDDLDNDGNALTDVLDILKEK